MTISSFIAGATATTPTAEVRAVVRDGSPPASGNGPTVSAFSPSNASAGVSNLVSIESTAGFKAIYLSVAGAATSASARAHTTSPVSVRTKSLLEIVSHAGASLLTVPLLAATDPANYLYIDLPSPVTTLAVAVTYPTSLPSNGFDLQIRAADAGGVVGPAASIHKNQGPPNAELIGIVYGRWIGTPEKPGDQPDPIAGAVVSTSLDGRTAVTDANGYFDLQTNTPVTGCFTFQIAAAGQPTFTASRREAGNVSVVRYTLGSTPQYPIYGPCS